MNGCGAEAIEAMKKLGAILIDPASRRRDGRTLRATEHATSDTIDETHQIFGGLTPWAWAGFAVANELQSGVEEIPARAAAASLYPLKNART